MSLAKYSPSRSGNNLMSPRLCECREGSREHEGKDEDYTDGVRACSNGSFDGELVKQPDRNHE